MPSALGDTLTILGELSSSQGLANLPPTTLGFCSNKHRKILSQCCSIPPSSPQLLAVPCTSSPPGLEAPIHRRYQAELVARAYPPGGARERDFLLGRLAVEATGVLPSAVVVGSTPTGAPSFPQGWQGSIAHTSMGDDQSFAVSAIMRSQAGFSIGVDIELLERPISFELVQKVASPQELQLWGDKLLSNSIRIGICSLKEAVFKALSHYSRSALPWKSIEIIPNTEGVLCRLPEQINSHTSVTLVMAQMGELLVSLAYAHTR